MASARAAKTANINSQVGRAFTWRTIEFLLEININCKAASILHDREERFDGVQIVSDRGRRHRGQEPPPIAFGTEPRVEHRQYPAVAAVAYQPAKALLEGKNRQRHLIFAEWLATAGADPRDSCGKHRIAGRGKRQLVDDDAAQRVAHHIHSLPEARRREQD